MIQLLFNGAYIVRTTTAHHVWEVPYYPQLYFHKSALTSSNAKGFTSKQLEAIKDDSGKTVAHQYSLSVGERSTKECLVFADDLSGPAESLNGLVKVDFGAMDQWLEEATPIFVHPKDPFRRVDILHSTRPVKVSIDGTVVAEATSSMHLYETGLPVRFYLPLTAVRPDILRPSSMRTRCPYKGEAEYYSVDLGDGKVVENVVWYYNHPTLESAKIEGNCHTYSVEQMSDLLTLSQAWCASTTKRSTSSWMGRSWSSRRLTSRTRSQMRSRRLSKQEA